MTRLLVFLWAIAVSAAYLLMHGPQAFWSFLDSIGMKEEMTLASDFLMQIFGGTHI